MNVAKALLIVVFVALAVRALIKETVDPVGPMKPADYIGYAIGMIIVYGGLITLAVLA